jgi:hypothetical protein
MADEKKESPKTAIVIATITVVGSVACAWITTQAKFDKELDSKGPEVARLKQDLETTERRYGEQQRKMEQKIEAAERRLAEQQKQLDARIGVVDDRLKKLDGQITAPTSSTTRSLPRGKASTGPSAPRRTVRSNWALPGLPSVTSPFRAPAVRVCSPAGTPGRPRPMILVGGPSAFPGRYATVRASRRGRGASVLSFGWG